VKKLEILTTELHVRVSRFDPKHPSAISLLARQIRECLCTPPPQVAVQSVHSPHPDQAGQS